MQGKLIVFEGIEGCGKTTQLQRSRAWLSTLPLFRELQTQGYLNTLTVTREPGGTEIGQAIRHLLLNPVATTAIAHRAELLLYAADRAQHVETLLKPQLDQGALILCDRYIDSTVAYQGYGRQLDLALIETLNQIATHNLESDLTLWLDLDVEEGLARASRRGSCDRIEQSSLSFHRRVQQGFIDLAHRHPHRIVRIDASGSEEAVAHEIQLVLQHRLTQWYSPHFTRS